VVALGTRHGKQHEVAPELAAVGLTVVVEPIDTDAFGTFSGSVRRRGTAEETVVAKARAAATAASRRFGCASEGSFFVAPELPWCTTQEELVALVDTAGPLVVVGRHRCPAPWAVPGTDLRAHQCPPRRPAIRAAAADLAARLARSCRRCGAPGVGIVRVLPGRPCGWCGGPTLEPSERVLGCPTCGGEEVEPHEGTADPGSCPACNP
jgi:hypothetical protein